MNALEQSLGKIIALRGDRATVGTLLASMAAKFQETGTVLFIDAENAFNPLFLAQHCPKPQRILKRVQIARPFTFSQLRTAVHHLAELIPRSSARALIVAGIDRLYLEESDQFVLADILLELRRQTTRHNLITILGLSASECPVVLEEVLHHAEFCCKV